MKMKMAMMALQVGVSAKPSSWRGGNVPAVVEEVRKRATHLPNTPVKKLKVGNHFPNWQATCFHMIFSCEFFPLFPVVRGVRLVVRGFCGLRLAWFAFC